MFFNFVHSRLYNQQVEEASPLADVDDSQVQGLEPTEETSTFDKFLFQRIDVKELFCERMSSGVEHLLRHVERVLNDNGVLYWGQIYTENQKTVTLLSPEEYRIFSANVERCFGRKVYDIPYIQSVLTPMLSDYSQKKAAKEMVEKEMAENAAREHSLKAPISEVFGKETDFYQSLSRSGKNRVTRILKKLGCFSLAELMVYSPEDLQQELKSPELVETFQICVKAYA